jgi:prepilin-type N-terminal cleavage/methylation domain-containing protein
MVEGRGSGVIDGPLAGRVRAFTLIELLVVVGIILILMVGAVPAFYSLKGGSDFSSQLSLIASSLEQSRAYSMANNTYVFWDIQEVDARESEEGVVQVNGTGRIAIGVVASLDGTRIYDTSAPDLPADWSSKTLSGFRLIQLRKVAACGNMSLSPTALPNSGNLARPGSASQTLQLTNLTSPTLAYTLPLGSPAPRFSFEKCIQFDPQGAATVISAQGGSFHSFEIGFVPAHGAEVDPKKNNAAVLQVDSATGVVRLYRR